MIDKRQAPAGPLLVLGLGTLALVASTLAKIVHTPTALAAGAWPLVVLVGFYLLAERTRVFGWFSVAGVTAALSILAFWLKWILDSQPHTQLRVLAFDNDGAIRAYGIFLIAFSIAWRFATHNQPNASDTVATSHSVRSGQNLVMKFGTSLLLFTAALTLILVRLYLAKVFLIGVPGVAPRRVGGLRLVLSLVYYLAIAGPLCGAGLLAMFGPMRFRWIPSLVILTCFSAVGASIGYRSYAILAFLTVAFAVMSTRPETKRTLGGGARRAVLLVSAFAAALVAVSFALASRAENQGTTAHGGTLSFLSERVGGLDYLSPVVSAIDRQGADSVFLDPSAWDAFMRVSVYGFPSTALTGVSATLPGWLYGVQGVWGLVLGGILMGLLAAWVDKLCLRLRQRGPVGTIVTLGAVLSWINLLGEGTPRAAVSQAVGFALLAIPILLLNKRASIRARLTRLEEDHQEV